jgi:type II secretory pathway pseudopilin PulG
MNRRAGATLLEVLVAIFIMGIGLLAILALFPLGAFRMAEAIQNDRAGHLALNGLAVAQTYNLRNDSEVTAAFSLPDPTPGTKVPPVHPDLPGYPVYVDPVGVRTTLLAPLWVGGQLGANPGQAILPRRASAFVGGSAAPSKVLTLRWFALTDDILFGPDGIPPAAGSAVVEREGSLSYALMFRRPRSSVSNVVEVSVVVYSRRPLVAKVGGGETPYAATFNTPSTNMITLNTTGSAKPRLQAGSWILDATFKTATLNNQAYGWSHAYFYRVVSVNETAPDVFEIEVATPLRDWPAAGNGTIIVMDNVVEVLERGTGW